MPFRDWFRPPRHLLALFAAVTVVPALALGWLAWRSLGQDAALDRQRVKDTLETALSKVVADLQRRLDDVSRQLCRRWLPSGRPRSLTTGSCWWLTTTVLPRGRWDVCCTTRGHQVVPPDGRRLATRPRTRRSTQPSRWRSVPAT
jgi:hypothetical protein